MKKILISLTTLSLALLFGLAQAQKHEGTTGKTEMRKEMKQEKKMDMPCPEEEKKEEKKKEIKKKTTEKKGDDKKAAPATPAEPAKK